jgi:hypothetical protein
MSRLTVAFALIAGLLWPATSEAGPSRPRAVIELFTSQGCSSCPPADLLLREYAAAPDVVALSYPVRIWDHLGWRDTLATEANTRRQAAYAEARGDRQVYTPQAIVNGLYHVVGSERSQIEARCRQSLLRGAGALSVPVSIARDGNRLVVDVEAWPSGQAPESRLLVVTYDRVHTVRIERGENRGRSLTYHNVVRTIEDRGPWTGAAVHIELSAPADEGTGVAVLVQARGPRSDPGMIVGAARTP